MQKKLIFAQKKVQNSRFELLFAGNQLFFKPQPQRFPLPEPLRP